MSNIFYNVPGSLDGGGPSVHVARMTKGLMKRGHSVIYKRPQNAQVAMCIINAGKTLKQVDRKKTRVILRVDGIYNELYNQKFNRAIRKDMADLHSELAQTIPILDHTVYQSQWSFDRIQDEIITHNQNYSIIHNGCDTNLFKPTQRKNDGVVKLIHCGRMRDAYLMEMLIGTYLLVKQQHRAQLILIGGMDAACAGVYKKHAADKNIIRMGAFPNNKLTQAYNQGDIFLDVRQGSSSNNTVVEAQSCGLPVITSSWGGDAEMILDGRTGVVVEGGRWDYDATYIQNLANGVDRVVSDLAGFKSRARDHAVKELSVDKMIAKYLKAMKL